MPAQSDLNSFLIGYCAAFRPGNIAGVAEFYHLPVTMVFDDQVNVLNSAEQVKQMLQGVMDNLIKRDFCRSRVDKLHIHNFTGKTALLSASFSRLNRDDQILEQLGATYTVVNDGENYKIAALVAHGTEAIVAV